MSTANSNHFISLEQAKKMTKKYRDNKKSLVANEKSDLPISETFDRAAFDALLAQPGCVKVRAYYGMDENTGIHLVFVGVNEKDEDMIAIQAFNDSAETSTVPEDAVILDGGIRCPPI